jgi:hypothetical protein
MLSLMSVKAHELGVDCEGMCKKLGAYPDCQCPGFAGEAASDDDTRACFSKYCQDPDPKASCPNDGFVGCVKEGTKVSALQWDAVMSRVNSGLDSLVQTVRLSKGKTETQACASRDLGVRALLQAKAENFGVDCEGMCKKLGAYPDCQCPGFAGEAASDDDTRACFSKYCQDPDPKASCPNDGFVGCVKEGTKVSALQWDKVMSRVNHNLDSLVQTVRLSKKMAPAKK